MNRRIPMNIERVYVICARCGRNNPVEAIECPRCHWTPPGQKSFDERIWDTMSDEMKDVARLNHKINQALAKALILGVDAYIMNLFEASNAKKGENR